MATPEPLPLPTPEPAPATETDSGQTEAPDVFGTLATLTPIDEIVVVIPANNEEELLGGCLTALEIAMRVVTAESVAVPTVRVVLVLDSCTDASAAIAARWPAVEVITAQFRNVGQARAFGVGHALRLSSASPDRVWIANTDADSQVPPHWIARQLAIARSGIRLMIGSVRPDPRDLTPAQRELWTHRHPVETATKRIYGANLGVRADGYLAVGGFPAIIEHEDVVLVDRLHRHGVSGTVSHSCWVQTSARIVGRTPGGFAAHVRENY